jgi:hypothetical protein
VKYGDGYVQNSETMGPKVGHDSRCAKHSSVTGKGKGNVKLFLCLNKYDVMNTILNLIKHHAMKTHGKGEVQVHAFLTLALDGGQ